MLLIRILSDMLSRANFWQYCQHVSYSAINDLEYSKPEGGSGEFLKFFKDNFLKEVIEFIKKSDDKVCICIYKDYRNF